MLETEHLALVKCHGSAHTAKGVGLHGSLLSALLFTPLLLAL